MSDIKLSFCIPTYNRADYIGQTLESMAVQIIEGEWTDCIEVCISDNASQDDTDDVIRKFQSDYPSVRTVYSKNCENMGADRNYLRVVTLASGEYCWLFGSDDILAPHALGVILQEIKERDDIYLGNRINCSFEMKPITQEQWLVDTEDQEFDFSKRDNLIDYFQRSQLLGAVFSYLSCIIFKKIRWRAINYDISMVGTAYSHVYMLISMVKNGAKLKYINNPIVLCRLENDSFAVDGDLKRLLLDFDGYFTIAEKLLPDADEKKLFLSIMTHEHSWIRLAKFRYFFRNDWELIHKKLLLYHFNESLILRAEFIGTIPFLVPVLLKIKHFISNIIPLVLRPYQRKYLWKYVNQLQQKLNQEKVTS